MSVGGNGRVSRIAQSKQRCRGQLCNYGLLAFESFTRRCGPSSGLLLMLAITPPYYIPDKSYAYPAQKQPTPCSLSAAGGARQRS